MLEAQGDPTMATIEQLRPCELFSELKDDELVLIAPLCQEERYSVGDTIIKADEPAVRLFILQEGRVQLRIRLRSGVELSGDVTIEDLEPGQIFGWSSLVRQERFTATGQVTEPAVVLSIDAHDLNALFAEHTHIGFVVMKQLANVVALRLHHTRTELDQRAQALVRNPEADD